MTNCKNCGAPLVNGKCEYCETEYSRKDEITLHVDYGCIDVQAISNAVRNSFLTPNEARERLGLNARDSI